jgi:hypothetical protein
MLGSHRSLCLDRRGSSLVIIRTDIIELVISVIPCVVKSERFPAMCRRACRRSQVAVKLWETPTGVPPTIGETGDRWDGALTLNKMELSRLTHKRSSLDNGAPPRRDL